MLEDAVQEQIGGEKAHSGLAPGRAARFCQKCGKLITQRQREAFTGTRSCGTCQTGRDEDFQRN